MSWGGWLVPLSRCSITSGSRCALWLGTQVWRNFNLGGGLCSSMWLLTFSLPVSGASPAGVCWHNGQGDITPQFLLSKTREVK